MIKSALFLLTGFILSSSVLAEQTTIENQAATATEAVEATQAETTPAETTPQTEPTQSATTEVAEEQSGFSRGSVMRSVFTNGIEEREPVDDMKSVGNSSNKITYFTELRDMSGQVAHHRWEYKGEVMADVEFDVRGPRWRVWSSKSFMPDWEGEWKVSVLNAAGEVIAEEVIDYKQPPVEEAAPAMPATDTEPAVTEPAITDAPQQ